MWVLLFLLRTQLLSSHILALISDINILPRSESIDRRIIVIHHRLRALPNENVVLAKTDDLVIVEEQLVHLLLVKLLLRDSITVSSECVIVDAQLRLIRAENMAPRGLNVVRLGYDLL